MKQVFFKDIKIMGSFTFGDLLYLKTSEDKGLSFAGSRLFNLMEIVSID